MIDETNSGIVQLRVVVSAAVCFQKLVGSGVTDEVG